MLKKQPNMSCVFRRRQRRLLQTTSALAAIFLLVLISISLFSKPEVAWISRSEEVGILRVMRYIEREREVDSVVRDAFVDRIWRSVKMDLVSSLVNKMESRDLMNESFIRENLDAISGAMSRPADNIKIRSGENSSNTMRSTLNVKTLLQDSPKGGKVNVNVSLPEFLSKPIVNHFKFSYIHQLPFVCSDPDMDILIAVPSAPGNQNRRELVRKSQSAKFASDPVNRSKLVFFLGRPDTMDTTTGPESSGSIQTAVDREQVRHGDIVQADFVDMYHNIRNKAALLMDWSRQFCSNARFLIRTDDDVTVNMEDLRRAMEARSATFDHFILGSLKSGWSPQRKRKSKYFVSFEENPYKYYPPFLLGGVMGYPIKTGALLLEGMRRVVPLWLDDVYVTAMCARRVGVPIFNSTAFSFYHP